MQHAFHQTSIVWIGLVFAVAAGAQAPTYSVVYGFTGTTDGSDPQPGLIHDAAGNLYGTTHAGGVSGCSGCGFGVVFKLDTTGNLSVLHTFTLQADGGNPDAGVIRDPAGNLYGTATYGGADHSGVVFKIDPAGNFTLLHTFTGGADGGSPHAGLIRDGAGNLYGTTANGGTGKGVVFQIDAAGILSTLHAFMGSDGAQPAAPVMRDASGNLYGTAANGGKYGAGVVFKLDAAANFTVLHSFTSGFDGEHPYAGLIEDTAGNLYGTTHSGGTNCATGSGCGVVFRLDPAGNLTVLHSFTGGTDGGLPGTGSLTGPANGDIYGATPAGGASNDGGVLFRLDTAGNFSVVHTFAQAAGGISPSGGLLLWGNSLYGTTAAEGPHGDRGVIFKLQ